jgi:type II secretory pathway pseudopilin PulG
MCGDCMNGWDVVNLQSGFTLIEIVLIILIIGIIGTIALRSLQPSMEQAKETATLREMDQLTAAIIGDPARVKDGIRTDFGYVGDIGSLPPDLDALFQNPGGYSTWTGPYIGDSYETDAWGDTYVYTGGVSFSSPGGGSPITKQFAGAVAELTSNTIAGTICDGLGAAPGDDSADVTVTAFYPDGAGSTTSQSSTPNSSGGFEFANSIPIGNHLIRAINSVGNETTQTYISVIPAGKSYCELRFSGSYWYSNNLVFNVNNNLVGHWKLDETSGTIAHDASGFNNHGTLKNMNPGTDWVAGIIDGALDFDGSNDYIDIGIALSLTDSLSVSAWVKPASVNIDRQVISKGNNGAITQWELKTGTVGGMVDFRKWQGGPVGARTTQTLTSGTWTHLVGTWDGVAWKVYWDGVLSNANTTSGPVATNFRLFIGAVDANGTPLQFWHGLIDDVRVYSRALSPAEVQILYSMGN